MRSFFGGCVALWVLSGCGGAPLLSFPVLGVEKPLFVVVGSEGTILRSETGTDWTPSTSGVTAALSSVAAGKGRFVAVGAAGTVLTSDDGEAWTARTSGTTVDLEHVLFDGARFLAVGGDWSQGAAAIASADGVTWEGIDSPSNQMFHSAGKLGDELVVAARYKSDLQTPSLFTRPMTGAAEWRASMGPNFSDAVTVDGTLWVVDGSRVSSTTDASAWTHHDLPSEQPHRALAWSGSSFVVAGEGASIHSSPDGVTWTLRHTGAAGSYFNSVAHGEPGFVAVGGGAIVSSADGQTWTAQKSGSSARLRDVVFRAR